MTIFWFSLAGVALAMLGMSAGVLLGRRPLAGSCGGLGDTSGVEGCEICAVRADEGGAGSNGCAGSDKGCRRGAQRDQALADVTEAA